MDKKLNLFRDLIGAIVQYKKANPIPAEFNLPKSPSSIGGLDEIWQLLSNLISNAIEYREKDSPVKIAITADLEEDMTEASTAEKYFVIPISDNGIGMEQSHFSKIATIFQRLQMRNEYLGNGVGLANCKKIMGHHNGKITVESTIGEGRIFHLYFPIIHQANAQA